MIKKLTLALSLLALVSLSGCSFKWTEGIFDDFKLPDEYVNRKEIKKKNDFMVESHIRGTGEFYINEYGELDWKKK